MTSTAFVLFSLFLHKYNEIGIVKERMSVMCTGYIIKMALMAGGSVYMIFMGFSRVYLGAHSYNQVLFGATFGTVLAVICYYQLKSYYLAQPDRHQTTSFSGTKVKEITRADVAKSIVLGTLVPINLAMLTYWV